MGSSLPALVSPLSCMLRAATKLQSSTSQAPLSSSQTSRAKTPPPAKTRPVRCAHSSLEPGTLLSEPCLFKISSKATSTFPSPAGPLGWLFSLSAWIYTARTHPHLVQGTRSSKTLIKIKDIKRYLQVASTANDGLLVVQHHEPLSPSREPIIVPCQALDGLLTAVHIQLNHPSYHQLRMVVKRYLFAICSIWTRQSLMSLMDATPVQHYEALQLHILTSLLPTT